MNAIRCSGSQLRAISEQVRDGDQQIILTQVGDSTKVGYLPLAGSEGTVFDSRGTEHDDAWSK